ncbi:MAG: amidohydrolase family protein [Pseudomonadales bacterium]|nr:amidohydrolase family protein [Pseudomonadales bacterium]
MRRCARLAVTLLLAVPALAGAADWYVGDPSRPGVRSDARAPYASRYRPPAAAPVLIRDATVLTGTGERLDDADVLLARGKVVRVGTDLKAPQDAEIVEAAGRWVTPGLIDVHSHLGDYPAPAVEAHSDGNESTSPVTARVWAEHSVWPQDPQLPLALMGGVTTLQVLPGSANLIGGRGVTLKNVPGRSVMDMKFPGAPHSLKMACGENPKRVYGRRTAAPSTRMGNVAGYRESWIRAREYLEDLSAWESGEPGMEAPVRDLELETLAGVLRGEILVHNHCYRADEMLVMLEIAREFGYRITAFHHATEAYKIADVLAEEGVCAALWADWWGFKLEAFDAIEENVALVEAAGACAIVHSDSPRDIQRLNQEAAKALMAARRMGATLDEADAIRWLTANAAEALGVGDRTGRLAPGYMADVVLWSGNPFSVYSTAQRVWIDGVLRYSAEDPAFRPLTDFDVGQTPAGRGEVLR